MIKTYAWQMGKQTKIKLKKINTYTPRIKRTKQKMASWRNETVM